MKRSKILAVVLGVLCILGIAGCKSQTSTRVPVQKVSMLMGTDTGLISRYGGIVVSQNETKIERDDSKSIGEMLVKEGLLELILSFSLYLRI